MATAIQTRRPTQWTDEGTAEEVAQRIARDDAESIRDLINDPAIAVLETLYAKAHPFAKQAAWMAAAAADDRRAFAWLRYVGGSDSTKADIRSALCELDRESRS